MSKEVMKLVAEFDKRFTSMNGVDVPEKVSVPRDEWRALRDAIVQSLAQPSPVQDLHFFKQVLSVAIAGLYEHYKGDVLKTFSIRELQEVVDLSESLRPRRVEDIYKQMWVMLATSPAQPAPVQWPVRIYDYVWPQRDEHKDDCVYACSYTPGHHLARGELLAVVHPSQLKNAYLQRDDEDTPLNVTTPPAQPTPVPRGMVLLPKRMTQAMRDVTDQEGWTFEDLLAAAEAITEDEYNELAAPAAQPAPSHPDDLAVDRFATAMKEKMAKARAKGRNGWNDPEKCPTERLQTMLAEHIAKGDPVDVGNFAMMLWDRVESTAAQPSQKAIEWPNARDVGRYGDMSPSAHLRVGLDTDNDVYLSVRDESGGALIEFCTPGAGGGASPATRMALIALMLAIEQDNAQRPDKDWWAKRLKGGEA